MTTRTTTTTIATATATILLMAGTTILIVDLPITTATTVEVMTTATEALTIARTTRRTIKGGSFLVRRSIMESVHTIEGGVERHCQKVKYIFGGKSG